jgi:hypothetical protein
VRTLTRRVLRAGVRSTRHILEKIDPTGLPGNFSNPAFVYASTNAMLATFIADEPVALRPSYTWGLMHAALLAKALDIDRVAAIEFGVAGGNGLVALERAALKLERAVGVGIDVHGFDTGRGLPRPTDYRDMPNLYTESTYKMDVGRLRARLERATLHLGLVADTVTKFLATAPPPIGFISFDLDYYSSTVAAFAVLGADHARVLPRVHCYFDDIMGLTCSEFTGERLAIAEFNETHADRKIALIPGLRYFLAPPFAQQQWSEMMYLAHFFDHPLYGRSDGLVVDAERPLDNPFGRRRLK